MIVAILRLCIAAFVFWLSLLTVMGPPTYGMWRASIPVTELGHLLALTALVTLLPGWRKTTIGKIAAVFGIWGLVLSISPLLRALPVAARLPEKLGAAFGPAQPRTLPGAPPLAAPLAFNRLFRKPSSPEVRVTTIPFVVRDGTPLALDLYKRDRVLSPAPIVVMIYGGSWRSGSRTDLPQLNYYLASRGYAVAAVSYRFAPAHPFPAATEDVDAAIDYLEANAQSLALDRNRIALIGRSAGGHLALQSAYTRRDGSIKGVVGFYPPSDQKWGWEHPTNQRVYNSFVTLREFLRGDPGAVPDAYRNSSPINFVSPATVPTLLIHGSADPLVSIRQSERLDSALAAARRPHLLVKLPWATHGCDYFFIGPCGQISTFAVERFLASVLK
ncbi:MAG TPA: alpha/beta hydrolase [Gemmatimonadaceae bacterium]|nr:alpha/beta hydrolase [Gemmatimonadaceae bacterium]